MELHTRTLIVKFAKRVLVCAYVLAAIFHTPLSLRLESNGWFEIVMGALGVVLVIWILTGGIRMLRTPWE